MTINRKDLGAGLAFVAIAALYGGIAWRSLPIGQALSMGPGYFPVVLSGLIGLIGAVLIIRSFVDGVATEFFGRIAWRALVLVSLAVILFGAFLHEVGIFAGVAGVTFLCAMASREFRPLPALLLALGLAAFCSLVFGYGVKLPIPVFGTLFVK